MAHITGPNAVTKLIVTFADERSEPAISLSPGTKGSMLLEAPAVVGKTYQFERFTDLINFAPIDFQFVATSPFVTTYLKPRETRAFYQLREID